jgi:hypothetical protein
LRQNAFCRFPEQISIKARVIPHNEQSMLSRLFEIHVGEYFKIVSLFTKYGTMAVASMKTETIPQTILMEIFSSVIIFGFRIIEPPVLK